MNGHGNEQKSLAAEGLDEFFAEIERKHPGSVLRSVLNLDSRGDDYISVEVCGDRIVLDVNRDGCLAIADLCDQFISLSDHRDHLHAYSGIQLAVWSYGLSFISTEDQPSRGDAENGSLQCDFMQDELFIYAGCKGYAKLAVLLRSLEAEGVPDVSVVRLRPGTEQIEESFECLVRLVSLGWDEHWEALPGDTSEPLTFAAQRRYVPIRDEIYEQRGIELSK